jgi:hypothetical protein
MVEDEIVEDFRKLSVAKIKIALKSIYLIFFKVPTFLQLISNTSSLPFSNGFLCVCEVLSGYFP